MTRDDPFDDAPPPPRPTLISGKWVLLAVLALSVGGAAFGWLWNYNAQRRPREFWGYEAWVRIARAPYVTAQVLEPEPKPTAERPFVPWYAGLVLVPLDPDDGARYVVARERRVEKAPGLSLADQSTSLREALGFHRSYLWDSKAAELQEPVWRYALIFGDAPPTETKPAATPTASAAPTHPPASQPPPMAAVLLFDADCRFVRLQMVDKPATLDPRTAEQFKKFFAATFEQAK